MLPKALRERHGLTEGVRFDVTEDGASILITPRPSPVRIVEEQGRLVARGGGPVTDEIIRDILEDIRP